jgi:hypothetical protein
MQFVQDLTSGQCRELHVRVPGAAAGVAIGALFESIESWRTRTGRRGPDMAALVAAGDVVAANRVVDGEMRQFLRQAGVTGLYVYSSPFLQGPLAAGHVYSETELAAVLETAIAAGAIVDQGLAERPVSRAKLNGSGSE